MANAVFSFEDYNFGRVQDEFRSTDGAKECKNNNFNGFDDWKESKGMDYGFNQVDPMEEGFLLFNCDQQQEQKSQSYEDYEVFDEQRLNIQTCFEDIAKLGEIPSGIQHISEFKENQNAFSLLKKYDNGRLDCGRIIDQTSNEVSKFAGQKLSTEEIVRIAGARFIQSYSRVVDIASMLNNPFGLSFSGFSDDEDSKNVELVEFLLASAEKVGYQQFERANRLLNHCDFLSSKDGNPVQRVVYYFSKALRDRIDRETGRISSKEFSVELKHEMSIPRTTSMACYQKIPFFQVTRFTGIQAIVENAAGAKRVHVIDLEIRCGAHWPVLMQALKSQHDCPLELLKITAIGTSSKQLIEDTGKRLASFADSMNLPFSFEVIMVSDVLELKEELFQLDPEEAVAIYSEYFLTNLIAVQNRLESVMRLLRKINPCIMVVMETEANNNSPSFVNRFIEALFFYSAYFDCFDACLDRDDPNRMIAEAVYYHNGIRNIVACEGEQRRIRHVKIDVWRSFFARFGMVETELSSSSLYQASLVLKQFACGSCCTLDMNEKCLLIGWKGTPIHSLSVWKFL